MRMGKVNTEDKTGIGYVTTPLEKRLMLLYTLLKKSKNKKILVIFNSEASEKFHKSLFFDFLDLKQNNSNSIVLRTYDCIKNTNFDLFDKLIFYEISDNLKNILKSNSNKILLILNVFEIKFLDFIKNNVRNINFEELSFSWSKIINIQLQVDKLVSENYSLNVSAKEAYKEFLRKYNKLKLKEIFNIKNITLKKLCLCFGFKIPVGVDLTDEEIQQSERRLKRKGSQGYGYYEDDEKTKRIKSDYKITEEKKTFKVYKQIKNRRSKKRI